MSEAENEQVFSDLSPEDEQRLEKQRAVVLKYLPDTKASKRGYELTAGKLDLLEQILKQKVFREDQKYELQCLGIVFGDALQLQLGLRWQMVEDSSGMDPCLILDGTSITLYPLTMISKRIERGEEVDVHELFDGVLEIVDDMKKKGY
jgi:hypothetical protein